MENIQNLPHAPPHIPFSRGWRLYIYLFTHVCIYVLFPDMTSQSSCVGWVIQVQGEGWRDIQTYVGSSHPLDGKPKGIQLVFGAHNSLRCPWEKRHPLLLVEFKRETRTNKKMKQGATGKQSSCTCPFDHPQSLASTGALFVT